MGGFEVQPLRIIKFTKKLTPSTVPRHIKLCLSFCCYRFFVSSNEFCLYRLCFIP